MIPIARKLIIIVDQLGFLVNMEDPSRFLVPPDDLTTLPNENNSLNADEVEKAQNVLTKTSVKKKETLAYYSHAIAQFGYFKDAWRNNISHGNNVAPNREFYLEGETTDIMNSAKLFMQHLAKRIKE